MGIFIFNKIRDRLQEVSIPTEIGVTKGIMFWKERILRLILIFGSTFGLLIYIPSLIYFLLNRQWVIVSGASILYFWIVFLTLNKKLGYSFHTISLVVILFILNNILMFAVGPFGAVPVWLFLFPIAATGFLPFRFGFVALGLNALTFAMTGFLNVHGYLNWQNLKIESIGRWINMGLNFLLLNGLLTVVLILLLKNLEKSRETEEEATSALRLSHKALVETNERLTREISERKQAESALVESEKRYRRLVSQMNEGVVVLEKNHRITFANGKLQEMTGYPRSELINISFYSLFPGEEKLKSESMLNLSDKGQSSTLETRISRKDGVEIPVLVSTTAVYQSETIWDLIVVITDITELKNSEKLLRENQDQLEEKIAQRTFDLELSRKQAEQANQAKSEFLANVSHEFRTPLHHILNFSKFGIRKFDEVPQEKLLHYFNQIRKTGERLALLVDDLLDLSKLESGKMTFEMDQSDLSQIAKEAINGFDSALREKQLSINFIQPDFRAVTRCDNFKISQVIQNLISNSVKFSRISSEITLKIIEVSHMDRLWLEVVVSDEGVGIPQSETEQIFEKFIQSSRTKSGAGGTGLGLSICKQIVLAHNGRIWAESLPGKETTVHFQLPKII